MKNQEYNILTDKLRHTLNFFRYKLLLSDLFKGIIVVMLFFMVYLLLYSLIIHLFPMIALIKAVLYFTFIIIFFLLFSFFIIYPVFLFFLSFNLKKDILLNRILKFVPDKNDVLISLYNLAFHIEKISGDEHLKKAAFIQKYNHLSGRNLNIVFSRKMFFLRVIILFIALLVFFGNNRGFTRLYNDLKTYKEVRNPEFNVSFNILNETLNVEYGKPFQLKLDVVSEYFKIDNVFICFGGGEFLMDRADSLFTYDFEGVNNDIKFYFKTSGTESKPFLIHVLPTPEITDYKVTCSPPAYTQLNPEVLKNIVDFRALYGSVLKFDLNFSDLDSLYLQIGNDLVTIPLESKSGVVFSRTVKASGEYSFYGSNENFKRKNLINFSITCIPDLYPGIQITEMQDSLQNSLYYFYGVITDDYGFSDLRFNYSISEKTNTVMPVNIVNNNTTQEFYFSFDFSEFAGMDKAKINYFFEIFDNDVISGPKSTRSDAKSYVVPDLNTIFDYNLEVDNNVNSSLKEAEKLAGEIVSGVKDMQKKMLDNSVDNWEKQQLSKDIVEKKNKLDKLLNSVKENNQKKAALNKSFTKQDSVLMDKQSKIQELLDKVMDDEMKKLMDEFSKLSQEFSKEKFQNLDEKMKLSFDQMSEELDRNIELLKRFQVEERHDMISKQLDQLKDKQKKFDDLNNDKSVSRDSLSALSEEIENNLENVENNYNDLLKENQKLSAPYELKDQQKKFDDLSQKVDKQRENTSEGRKDKQLLKDIEGKINELSEDMEKQKQQNFNDISIPQGDIELIIQNILIISLSQEELLKQFPGVPPQSLKYNELGRLQDLKKQEYKVVKDSLSVLAKSNLALASILSDKFYDIEIKFGLLPAYIQNNQLGELMREQQYIINYLNDIALSLTDALQKSKEQGNGKGQKEGDKPGGKGGQGYGQMKQIQNGIKKQLENLVSKMKSGEKGKPLQQGISNMIRENELFRKSINDFISEKGSLSTAEKQLLNEINRLLEESIRDMANYSISGNLIERNNQIYNKLLMSEKASKEREEYEEKRRSETAKDVLFNKPEMLFDDRNKPGFIKTGLRKSDIKLSSFFKNMYNNYYIKLGNE